MADDIITYTIQRKPSTLKGTFGTFFLDDIANKICLTVELPWFRNVASKSCIPAGAYLADTFDSPKHGQVWMLQDVPNRSAIEIHPANDIKDLLGCIGVGDSFGTINGLPGVCNSQKTFAMLRETLPAKFWLKIIDAPQLIPIVNPTK